MMNLFTAASYERTYNQKNEFEGVRIVLSEELANEKSDELHAFLNKPGIKKFIHYDEATRTMIYDLLSWEQALKSTD